MCVVSFEALERHVPPRLLPRDVVRVVHSYLSRPLHAHSRIRRLSCVVEGLSLWKDVAVHGALWLGTALRSRTAIDVLRDPACSDRLEAYFEASWVGQHFLLCDANPHFWLVLDLLHSAHSGSLPADCARRSSAFLMRQQPSLWHAVFTSNFWSSMRTSEALNRPTVLELSRVYLECFPSRWQEVVRLYGCDPPTWWDCSDLMESMPVCADDVLDAMPGDFVEKRLRARRKPGCVFLRRWIEAGLSPRWRRSVDGCSLVVLLGRAGRYEDIVWLLGLPAARADTRDLHALIEDRPLRDWIAGECRPCPFARALVATIRAGADINWESPEDGCSAVSLLFQHAPGILNDLIVSALLPFATGRRLKKLLTAL